MTGGRRILLWGSLQRRNPPLIWSVQLQKNKKKLRFPRFPKEHFTWGNPGGEDRGTGTHKVLSLYQEAKPDTYDESEESRLF